MKRAVESLGMQHALGDCYCDDYHYQDPEWIAETLLNQVRDGSVIIMHMPERGYREHTFKALQLLLRGLSARGLRSVTLSHLTALSQGCLEWESPPDVACAGAAQEPPLF